MSDLKTGSFKQSLSKTSATSKQITLEPEDNKRLMSLCGRFDEHLRQIESHLSVELSNRGNQFIIQGVEPNISQAQDLLRKLYEQAKRNHELTPQDIHLAMRDLKQPPKHSVSKKDGAFASIQINHHRIQAKTTHQHAYIQNILKHDMVFGVGPAGTGKTFLAVACAVKALQENKVERILLTRPAVEAGERLGFLPGDLSQKIDPYLRPLLDALYEMLGFETTAKLLERNVIEIAPLAYMRGRTLNDAFIILDEAQNTTQEQMKMFLTRLGFSSKAVITGDITQIDLAKGIPSGLHHALKVLNKVEGISFNYFDEHDVIRHPLVQKVVKAYRNEKDQ